MALKVGELYATMKLDNSGFNTGLDQSGRRFDGFRSVVSAGMQTTARLFAGATTATLGLGAAALRVGLDYNRLQQSSRAALTTLLGSAEAANAQMDKLDEFAKTSPFAKQVFITAQQQLIGFGMAAEDVLPTLDAIQNAVAAVGGSNEDIAEITRILATVQSSGKITAETFNQLGVRGVDAASILGEKWGKTAGDVRKAVSDGAVDAGEAIKDLTDGMMARFGGATDNIKAQMDGAADRVKGAWRDIGSTLANPLIDTQGGGLLVGWTNQFADAMRAAEQKAKPFVDLLVTRYKPALDAVGPALDRVRSGINRWDLSKVNGQLDALGKYAPLIGSTSAALFAMGTSNLPILSSLGLTGISPVVAGLAGLVATSPEARDALRDVFRTLEPLLPVFQALGIQLADVLMYALQELAPAFGDLGASLASVAVDLAEFLLPAVRGFVDLAGPAVDTVAGLVKWFADLPAPVQAVAAAFVAMRATNIVGVVTGLVGHLGSLKGGFETARLQAMYLRDGISGVRVVAQSAGTAAAGLGRGLLGAFGGPVGLAIMGVAAAVTYFSQQQAQAKNRAKELADTFDEVTGAATESTEALVNQRLLDGEAARIYANMGGDLNDLSEAAMGSADALERVNAFLDAQDKEQFLFWEFDTAGVSQVRNEINELNKDMENAREESERYRKINQSGTDAQQEAADAAREHADRVKDLTDAQRENAGAFLSQREAQIRATEAQTGLNEALDEGLRVTRTGRGEIDLYSDSTMAVDSALLDFTRSQHSLTDAMRRNNAEAGELDQVIRGQREAFIDAAVEMGRTREEAEDLADALGLIPNNVAISVEADVDDARFVVSDFYNEWKNKSLLLSVGAGPVRASIGSKSSLGLQADGSVRAYANGLMPSSAVIQPPTPGLIQWAEPETHGEAFIPLAPSKRARSLAIWEETGRRLGQFAVVGRRFADGAVNAPVAVTSSATSAGLSDSDVARIAVAVRDGAAAGVGAGFGSVGSSVDVIGA